MFRKKALISYVGDIGLNEIRCTWSQMENMMDYPIILLMERRVPLARGFLLMDFGYSHFLPWAKRQVISRKNNL